MWNNIIIICVAPTNSVMAEVTSSSEFVTTESVPDETEINFSVTSDMSMDTNITMFDVVYNLSRLLSKLDGQTVDQAFSEVQ